LWLTKAEQFKGEFNLGKVSGFQKNLFCDEEKYDIWIKFLEPRGSGRAGREAGWQGGRVAGQQVAGCGDHLDGHNCDNQHNVTLSLAFSSYA
jgi:hypothetical protein